ncbi:MAG: aspartyl protease family protein [Candidatus Eremiobacteraeota bacterium]|nr:aspartyl protease family protein [Candidatus Eremiobacteraeota bacterium]
MNASKSAAAVFGAAALVCFPAAAHASVDAQSQRVIRQSGAALGVASLAHIQVIRADAKISAAGLTGTGTQWSDVRDGRFAEHASLPPIVQDDGYDGRVAWNRDGSGVVWDEGSDAGRSAAIDNAYLNTYALWKPDAAGAAVTYEGAKTEKGRAFDVLRITPSDSKLPVLVWFDASTHLPVREILARGPVVATTTLSGYRRTSGVMLPYVIHVDSTDGNNSDANVVGVAIDPAGAAGNLARPVPTVHDFSMQGGKTTTSVPVDLVENHVYLNVMLNGKGPYRFIFDTGGQNIVDPAVAREIGAFGKGQAQANGVGSTTESLSFAKVDSLQVGDALLRDQLFAVVPVRQGFGVSAGQPADGLIGWEVLARFVTSFNYAQKTVDLTLPSAAQAPSGAHVVPFVFNGTQPQIACAIDAIPSECTIDTGARDTLSFYAPFVAEHPSVKPAALTAAGVGGFGVGGPSVGQLGRVRSVQIDDITLNDLVGDFTSQTAGAFANPFTAANLGGNLLRRFDVTFDYNRQTMALVPNAAFNQPDTYERAGIFLIRNAGKPTVIDARPNTPAAQAGIEKGDVITSVDGTPTTGMSLQSVRDYFFRPVGTVLRLGVTTKDGAQKTVTLTLRDYV